MIDIKLARPHDMDDLYALFRAIGQAESHAPHAPEQAMTGLRQALDKFDFLRSDSFWLFLARVNGEPVGYATVCRIPKADMRAGFLFIDEVYVFPAHRRQGAARALLERVSQLAYELGLAGVRLLVRPQNGAARRLYQAAGFSECETIFCEKRISFPDDHSPHERTQ
jgi:ribosomal protein S18 acetylase RimI-like enzyme